MFANREAAGRALAQRLGHLRWERPVVEGIARGGVIVAAQIAKELHRPLDVAIVRKVRAPFQPELALGAVAEDGTTYIGRNVTGSLGITDEEVRVLTAEALDEAREMSQKLRGRRKGSTVEAKTVVLVDDGLATGATAVAAARSLRSRGASRIVLAVPVGAPRTIEALEDEVDEIVTLTEPTFFTAVGEWYEDFAQVTDAEVKIAVDEASRHIVRRADPSGSKPEAKRVRVQTKRR